MDFSNKMLTIKTEIVSSDTEANESEGVTIKSEAKDSDGTEIFNLKTEVEDLDETVVALDTYNSDLNLVIDANRFSAKPLTEHDFALMWAGTRATHGASTGKFCFEVKILDNLQVKNLPKDNYHLTRVGFSVNSSTLQLGEVPLSYAYHSTGNSACNSHFQKFAEPFTAGDVILGAVDAESEVVQIGFAKNGKFLGWAFQVGEKDLKGHSLFPHILTKNVSFEVNLGQKEQPCFPLPDTLKDFTFIGCLPLTQRVGGTRAPKKREDCEVIMMCGLPGAGKSTWAADYAAKNPAKKFNILGVDSILDKTKVMGLPIQKLPYTRRGKFRVVSNKLQEMASKLNRNYILDHSNLTLKTHLEVRAFERFRRKAAVVIPSEQNFQRRLAITKKKTKKQKWLHNNLLMMRKRTFILPEVNDIFSEVIYTELPKEAAKKLVMQYNDEARNNSWLPWKSNAEMKQERNKEGFTNDSDNNNRHFKKEDGDEGSRGCKRKFDDVESSADPFSGDSRVGRYFNSQIGDFQRIDNNLQIRGGHRSNNSSPIGDFHRSDNNLLIHGGHISNNNSQISGYNTYFQMDGCHGSNGNLQIGDFLPNNNNSPFAHSHGDHPINMGGYHRNNFHHNNFQMGGYQGRHNNFHLGVHHGNNYNFQMGGYHGGNNNPQMGGCHSNNNNPQMGGCHSNNNNPQMGGYHSNNSQMDGYQGSNNHSRDYYSGNVFGNDVSHGSRSFKTER